MTNKMSCTRALAELKRFDDRINREISENIFVGVTMGRGNLQKMMMGSGSVEQQSRNIQGSFDTVQSLIEQRQKIKAALVVSNSVATITLGGKTMTVAEAIEMKKSVAYKQQFVRVLTSQLNMSNQQVAAQNAKLETAIDTMVTQVMGASDKGKVDTTSYEAIAVPQRNAKEAALLDPKGIAEQIKKLTDEIGLVELELDFLLSESNAVTMIEV